MDTIQKPLPKGWKWVRLGEVCSVNPPKPKLSDEDDISFLPMSSVSDDGVILERQKRKYGEVKKGYTGFMENDILFAKITPCMENGKGAIARELINTVGFGSTEFHVIRASKQILPEHIFRYLNLKRIRRFAEVNMTGSAGQKRVPDVFLKTLKIPLPPLPTQHKIVEILEEADNLRKLRKQADEKMKDLIPSLFVQMFGDPATNPKGWDVKNIDDIKSPERFSIVDGPFGSSMKVSDYVEDGIPVIQVSNITPEGFCSDSFRYINEEKYNALKRSTVNPGDILIAKVGHTIGKACIIPHMEFAAIGSGQNTIIEIDRYADWIFAGDVGNSFMEAMALRQTVSSFIEDNSIVSVGGMYPVIKIYSKGLELLGHSLQIPIGGPSFELKIDSNRRWVQRNNATGKEIKLLFPWEIDPQKLQKDERFDDLKHALKNFGMI